MKKINEKIDSIWLPTTIKEEDQLIIILNSKYKGKIKKAIDTTTDIKIKKQLEQLYYSERLLIDNKFDIEIYTILEAIDSDSYDLNKSYNLTSDTKVITTSKNNNKILTIMKKLVFTEQDFKEETQLALYDLFKTGMCKFTKRIKQILSNSKIKYREFVLLSLKNKLKNLYQKAKFKIQILINNAKKIICFSGGKDSTAMLIKLIEEGEKIDKIVFADTGLEFPEMYRYIERVESYIKRKIEIVKGDVTFDNWFYGEWTKGKNVGQIRGFPKVVGLGCWAKRELKVKPLQKAEGKGNEIFIGIAADEQERAYREKYQHDNIYRLPLIEWGMTENDCIEFLKERNICNPLYDTFKRLGCWLCPKQGIGSLKKLYQNYPDLWNKLKKYEKDSPTGFKITTTLEELENRFKKEIWLEEHQLSMF